MSRQAVADALRQLGIDPALIVEDGFRIELDARVGMPMLRWQGFKLLTPAEAGLLLEAIETDDEQVTP